MTNVHPDRVIDHDVNGDIEITDAGPTRRTWLKNVALGAAGATAGAMAFGKNASAADGGPLLLGNGAQPDARTRSSTPTTLVYGGPAIDRGAERAQRRRCRPGR